MYPDPDERRKVQAKLSRYGRESHHREVPRVQLGILKVVGTGGGDLDSMIDLACSDYRNLLVNAEYPLTFGLDHDNVPPASQQKLGAQQRAEYQAWLRTVLGEDP